MKKVVFIAVLTAFLMTATFGFAYATATFQGGGVTLGQVWKEAWDSSDPSLPQNQGVSFYETNSLEMRDKILLGTAVFFGIAVFLSLRSSNTGGKS